MIPALQLAAVDRRLRHRTFRVLFYAAAKLATEEYRHLKHGRIAAALGIDRSDVAHAMAQLTELGYLDVGPMCGRLRTYRIAPLPIAPVTAPSMCGTMPQCRTA